MFSLGQVVMTRGVADAVPAAVVFDLICRHASGDFGDLCKEDRALNEAAITDGGRILSAYETPHGNFYVITEWDRSVTTVLFKHEY